ncbi:MAG: GlsB/YeaQ/YmgE family stress response membrane protein [Pikeienuella sp.]
MNSKIDAKQIVTVLVFGLVVGWLASLIVGGGSLISYVIWGVLGSLLAGVAVPALGLKIDLGHPLLTQLVLATGGAIVLVLVGRLLF